MKKRITHTVEESISDKFDILADKLCVNKSKAVEKMIKDWIFKEENIEAAREVLHATFPNSSEKLAKKEIDVIAKSLSEHHNMKDILRS